MDNLIQKEYLSKEKIGLVYFDKTRKKAKE